MFLADADAHAALRKAIVTIRLSHGKGTLEYYGIDKAGNVETTQRKMLRRTQ